MKKNRFPIIICLSLLAANSAIATSTYTIQPSSVDSLQITTGSLPDGAVSLSYNAALAAANGVPPYTWSLKGGQLPPGLGLLASTGRLSGTPTQAGAFTFSIQVMDSSGQATSSGFSANIAPASAPIVSSISPKSGPTSGGTLVTVSGANFKTGVTVLFGGVAALPVTVSSATQIQAVTPAHIAGTIDVTVQNADSQSSTLSGGFAYAAVLPMLHSVSPNSGPTAGGTTVTITGTNFLAGALVLFGSVSAPTTSVSSATQIHAVTPPGAAGIVDVTVQNPANLSGKLSGAFNYTASQSGPPTISSVSPSSGAPGTQIRITGTNFELASTVAFGSTDAASAIFVSSTQLEATVPSIASGTYHVTVTDPDPASATLNNGFTVTAAHAQSLLPGYTVTSSNQPNRAIPSGWTLVAAQGFESGTVGPHQALNQGSSITTAKAHTGTTSAGNLIASDGAGVQWFLSTGATNPFTELYISYWDWVDSNATIGTDYFYNTISTQDPHTQDTGFDVQWTPTGTSPPPRCGDTLMIAETTNSAIGTRTYQWPFVKNLCVNAGFWRQIEIDFRPNTCSGGVPNKDGFAKLYFSGHLVNSPTNVNLAGCYTTGGIAPTIQGQSNVFAGGYITVFCDAAEMSRATPFSKCPNAAPTPFHRYIDDIIVMKK